MNFESTSPSYLISILEVSLREALNAFKHVGCPHLYKHVTAKYSRIRLHSFMDFLYENNIFKEIASSNHYSQSIEFQALDFVLDNNCNLLPRKLSLQMLQIPLTKCNHRGNYEDFPMS
jgi:hypothetical protein